ncbi:unnamed protein product [Cuscuta campestris]|uniref:Uncharacterized protein n=1 Tax=Cuscuta campestris TaxID=132261 RepID=A0A484KPI2_9ASTE|nr:unnamed protein product [Cuscuta campestris]
MAAPSDPLASLPSGVKLLLRSLRNLIPEKLTETNYPAWSLNVQTALSANLLLGWIDGHEAAPAPTISKNDKTVPNPEYTSWTIVDTQIRACLLAVISPSVHKHARGFTTSAALWDALAARYNSVSTAHVYQLRDKLHTLRKGTKTMTQYLDDVATILSDLDALKEEIPERDVVNAVIRGLPTEYSSFKQNIRMNNTNISLNQLSGWLISEEINLEMENKLSLTESTITEPRTTLLATNGRGFVHTPNGKYHLSTLHYVPSLTSNLLSVHRFTKDSNCTLVFNANDFQIVDNPTNQVRYKGLCEHGLYTLPSKLPTVAYQAIQESTWHRTLGHPAPAIAKSILSSLGTLYFKGLFDNF